MATLFERLGNFIRKVGATLGMNKSLIDVVDDDRINMPASEYKRIAKDFRLYRNDYDDIFEHVGKKKHRRRQHTVNMTKTVARRMASIVFNEKAKVSFKNNDVDKFIDDVFVDNDFYNQFETNLEKGIVAGGFAMRPYVDDGKIKIAWVRADQFYPLRSNTNDIPECAIVSKTQRIEDHTVIYYSLLEFHQWDEDGNYIITNELYRSDNKDVIGVQVPLSRLYDDLQDQTNLGQINAPLFAYFHTPGANNLSLESPLGVGIVDNARGELKDINMINDAIHREIRYGKKRIVVPESMLKIDEVHKPYFDPEDPTYVGFNGDDSMQIQDITTNMRIDQLKSAMDFALRKLEVQVGLSAGTFSYDDSGLKTATEVVSDNSMTYQTRSSYLTMVEKSIKQLCIAILELANLNNLFSYDTTQDPGFDIYFDDGLFVDKDKQLDEDMKAAMAKLIPIKQFLIRNYGLSEKDADEWVEEIQEEQPKFTTNSFEAGNSPDDYQGADD